MGLLLIILASVWLLLGKLGSHRPSWRQGDLITSQRNDSQVLEKGFSGQLKIYISKGLKKGFNNCKFFQRKSSKEREVRGLESRGSLCEVLSSEEKGQGHRT